MKSYIFWDTTLRSPLKINRCLGRRMSQARNQHEAGCKQSDMFPKRRLIFNGLDSVMFQKIELFKELCNLCGVSIGQLSGQ
jgi:hypothetical protein